MRVFFKTDADSGYKPTVMTMQDKDEYRKLLDRALAELNSFRMLIGVSGVGPKAALSVLSAATPQNLALSIVTGDEKALTAAPGIGKKIAQRIILELKDKLAKEQSSFSAQGGGAVPVSLPGDKGGEAAAALAVLGYGSQEIGLALKGIDMDALPLEEIIRQALKKMVR